MKKDYWKAYSDSGTTVFCDSLDYARWWLEDDKAQGYKTYIRKVRMTEEEYKALEEFDE